MIQEKIVIVTNGSLSSSLLPTIKMGDLIIGVDRAAYWLLTQGIIPDVAIGDFDSTNKKELAQIKKEVKRIEMHPAEKNFTDTELALKYALAQKPTLVVIVGGVGTRLDHMLGTLHLLGALRGDVNLTMVDEKSRTRLVDRGRTILEKGEYPYVSIIPFTQKISVTLSGFKYPVVHKTITHGQTLGISNEFVASQAVVEVHAGRAWVIESRD